MCPKNVYLDNAASTFPHKEVVKKMSELYCENIGNPSSIHFFGRKSKVLLEEARKTIADLLKAPVLSIYFTSSATEANNLIIQSYLKKTNKKHIITSTLEHPSVKHCIERSRAGAKVHYVDINEKGHIDLDHLDKLTSENPGSLVVLMHANNEISNLLKMNKTAAICEKNKALFFSDMVQTIGHYEVDMSSVPVHFASASAHKFHGPKGAGFLYCSPEVFDLIPLMVGGAQERNLRPGTENVEGIAGMALALSLSLKNIREKQTYVSGLKKMMVHGLRNIHDAFQFIGDSAENGHYGILSVQFPETKAGDMLLNYLDMNGIAASAGSACSSGSQKRSHVMDALNIARNKQVVRFSFSPCNTKKEVEYCLNVIYKLLH